MGQRERERGVIREVEESVRLTMHGCKRVHMSVRACLNIQAKRSAQQVFVR